MNKIYTEIANLTDKFKTMAFGICNDENKINNAVQELMLYFLQMNPKTLKNIYNKDGIEGVTRYGAVALKRALTSTRSNFYYKYEKYYTNIDNLNYIHSTTYDNNCNFKSHANFNVLHNIAEIETSYDYEKEKKIILIESEIDKFHWYDKEIFKLYYYEGNTLDSLAKKTKISRNSLFTTIDKVRTELKTKCNEVLQCENKE
jgi:hypothetical protein